MSEWGRQMQQIERFKYYRISMDGMAIEARKHPVHTEETRRWDNFTSKTKHTEYRQYFNLREKLDYRAQCLMPTEVDIRTISAQLRATERRTITKLDVLCVLALPAYRLRYEVLKAQYGRGKIDGKGIADSGLNADAIARLIWLRGERPIDGSYDNIVKEAGVKAGWKGWAERLNIPYVPYVHLLGSESYGVPTLKEPSIKIHDRLLRKIVAASRRSLNVE